MNFLFLDGDFGMGGGVVRMWSSSICATRVNAWGNLWLRNDTAMSTAAPGRARRTGADRSPDSGLGQLDVPSS